MSGAGLDSRYISSLDLEPYFVSNQNGEANANGIVTFYKDNNRTQEKLVYQLSQDPMTGEYSYVPLPNPIILSGVGTFQNAAGDNIAVYYYPFDEFGNEELYYITVYDAFGNLQFTREAWPFPFNEGGGSSSNVVGIANQLSNPQFAFVNFTAGGSLSIPVTTGTTVVPIAPNWDLRIVATGSGTVTVTQTPITGQSSLPYNPPFTLDLVIGNNITVCQLVQTLQHNPGWATPATTGVEGYISASILLGAGTSASVVYNPSSPSLSSTTILTQTNTSGQYAQFTDTVQLPVSTSTDNGLNGFDEIIVNILNLPGSASISNVQIVPLTNDVSGVEYDQTPVNRQLDYLFNYYNGLLQYKPITSHLVGWDFALNPAQFLGTSIAAQSVGANKSYYAWDQTIVFQTTNSGLTISRDTTGALKVLAAQAGQHALVQYLPAPVAIDMLSKRKCVNLLVKGSVATNATVSLWYTKTTLPSTIGSNDSIVATLDANGYPATLNGTWTQVKRSGLSNATITITATNAAQVTIPASAGFTSIPLSGWDMSLDADVNSATYFAIVVGTASLAQNAFILYKDISCQDGDIATVTGAQSVDEVQRQCQYYYAKSYVRGVTPGTITPVNSFFAKQLALYDGISVFILYWQSFILEYPSTMNAPPVIRVYSATDGDPDVVDPYLNPGVPTEALRQPISTWINTLNGVNTIGTDRAIFITTSLTTSGITQPPGGIGTEAFINFQYTLDSRLGQ